MRQSQLKKAIHYGDLAQVEKLRKEIEQLQLFDFHHVSGFQHPQLPIIISDAEKFKIATWGLIPNWIKDTESAFKFYNNTLNAKSETMFQKNSFKDAAINKRCLIIVDGFYEHQHFNKKTYPNFISLKNKEPMILAGIWNDWTSKTENKNLPSFSIVTTKANGLMEEIHNNPKLEEARMPVILHPELAKNG